MVSSGDIILCSSEHAVAEAVRDLPHGMSLAFVRTASKLCADIRWLEFEREILCSAGFKITDITDLNRDAEQVLAKSDCIFIGGGNTFFLLHELRKARFDTLLIHWHQTGKILIGESAGALVLGPTIEPIRFIDEPEKAPELSNFAGLNIVTFFPAVHFGRPEFAEQYSCISQSAFTLKIPMLTLRDADSAIISQGKIELRTA